MGGVLNAEEPALCIVGRNIDRIRFGDDCDQNQTYSHSFCELREFT